jgi:hypothetical protein
VRCLIHNPVESLPCPLAHDQQRLRIPPSLREDADAYIHLKVVNALRCQVFSNDQIVRSAILVLLYNANKTIQTESDAIAAIAPSLEVIHKALFFYNRNSELTEDYRSDLYDK